MSLRAPSLMALGGLLLAATPVLALPSYATATPSCVGADCTVSFELTGAPEEFVVPENVTTLLATVAGGAGGIGHRDEIDPSQEARSGGAGGLVEAAVPVTPGQRLTVLVGGRGADGINEISADVAQGGYGGGGNGTSAGGTDGAGGGASYLFAGADVLVAAGGGGGGGYQEGGDGGGGGKGEDGVEGGPGESGGHGGTTTGPGAGGADGGEAGTGPTTAPTELGTGGTSQAGCPGGGGGGGYYGGGSGGCAGAIDAIAFGGGGGGAGFLAPGVTTLSRDTRSGDGAVVLRYTIAKPDSDHDGDHDGLTDAEEAKYGTDPAKADTDGDRLLDGAEVHGSRMGLRVRYGKKRFGRIGRVVTNPLVRDTDRDGLSDGREVLGAKQRGRFTQSDPRVRDTDRDGLSDRTEVTGRANRKFKRQATNPRNYNSDHGDASDRREIRHGSNPNVARSSR